MYKVISTFEEIISLYTASYANGLEEELDYFRELGKSTDKSAVGIANMLLMGSHQRYLNFANAKTFRDEAVRKLAESKLWDQQFSDFESLYAEVCNVIEGIPYIKDLVKYDVSKRLGVMFVPEVLPKDYVYIQSGAKIGAKKLLGKNFDDVKCVPISYFEPFFPNLSSVHIENILCIMKDYFSLGTVSPFQDEKQVICKFDNDSCNEC